MRVRHLTLAHGDRPADVTVVVDVLRAFTTAALALAGGAREIVCVRTVDEALAERRRRPGSLVMGEIDGLPVDGFDLSNSPAEILAADLDGRVLVQRTSAGTQGLVGSSQARHLLAASFVCAGATARAVRVLEPDEVSLVATGVDHRDGDEDRACADYLEALLAGADPDPGSYLERVRNSDAAAAFLVGRPGMPPEDVALAAELDAVDFALVATRAEACVVLRPQVPG